MKAHKPKFKVGDKVRVTHKFPGDPPVGALGFVLEEDHTPYVRFPGYTEGSDAEGLLPEGSREAIAMYTGQLALVQNPLELLQQADFPPKGPPPTSWVYALLFGAVLVYIAYLTAFLAGAV